MDIEKQIKEKLDEVESLNNVRILYACESGSRAWGFPSKDSDYDIRFIYARDPDWYLSVMPGRDVIELPIDGDIDMGGWDIRKSFALLRKSNCALIEWLSSPIVYKDQIEASLLIKQMVSKAFLATSSCNHYLAMARRKSNEVKNGHQAKLKAYFYALRATLCGKYIVDHNAPPPMLIDELINMYITNTHDKNALEELKQKKFNSTEGEIVVRIDWLDSMMESIQGEIENNIPVNQVKAPLEVYDGAFRKTLHKAWDF